jgi:LAO/AO transport system kinase
VAAGHIRSAARLITRIERDDPGMVAMLQALYRLGGRSRVIGVTGPPAPARAR